MIVTVQPVSDVPNGVDDLISVSEDMVANILPLTNDTDADGDILSIVDIPSLPANGTVTLSGSAILYTPSPNFNGSDSLSYRITDGMTTSSPIGITITVNPVNDSPISLSDSATTNEDTPVLVPVLANDSDLDGDTLTITTLSSIT